MLKALIITMAIVTYSLFLPGMTTAVHAANSDVVVLDNFNAGLSPTWKHEVFKGETNYKIVDQQGNGVLRGESHDSASALVFQKKYRLQDFPILSWRWKIKNILSAGDSHSKASDDYPARIYVVFPHWFVPLTRSINYIWANKLPKGEERPNSYAHNSILVAVQSGREQAGHWITERHNVLEDYQRIFGEEPSAVGGIAIMTDSDDTHGESLAWFDDLRLERKVVVGKPLSQ